MFTITCLVNDETQPGSGLRGEHGLSFLIETKERALLFDTGSSGQTLLHNASILGMELRRVMALVISHSHPDHTGGCEPFSPWCPVVGFSPTLPSSKSDSLAAGGGGRNMSGCPYP